MTIKLLLLMVFSPISSPVCDSIKERVNDTISADTVVLRSEPLSMPNIEMPASEVSIPNTLNAPEGTDPMTGLSLVQPPTANNRGTADIYYPIEIPAGRQGMQPNLALSYNSGSGNGFLGVGWDMGIPTISFDTRWGVPRYDNSWESDIYTYGGSQLVTFNNTTNEYRKLPFQGPVSHNTPRLTGDVRFYQRHNDYSSDSIVRHGDTPSDYWWSVTDPNGVTHYYGAYAAAEAVNNNCVLRADTGSNNTTGPIAQWALAESVDPFGNSVKYFYSIDYDYGVADDKNHGRQIYLDSIRYTDHNTNNGIEQGIYTIAFTWKDREDVIIAANRGFKEVTAKVLCLIEVKCQNEVVWRYMMFTENSRNSMYKTRISDIVKIDSISNFLGCGMTMEALEANKFEYGTRTHFDYYDYPSANALFGEEHTYTLPNDNIKSTFLTSFFNNNLGCATALGATKGKNWSAGGTATLGIGPDIFTTYASVGANFDYSHSANEGMLTLIDLNGDGLADKVFKRNDTVFVRKRLSFADSIAYSNPQRIAGIEDFLTDAGHTVALGLQLSVGCTFSAGWPVSWTFTDTYFADVNADGLPDIITKDGGIMLNKTASDGNVAFEPMGQTNGNREGEDPCGTYFNMDGSVNDSIDCHYEYVFEESFNIKNPCENDELENLCIPAIEEHLNSGHYAASYQYNDEGCLTRVDFYVKEMICGPENPDPDLDAVRVWVAPKTGNITLTSTINLIDDESESRQQAKYVDGVKYTIQHNSAPTADNDKTLHSLTAQEIFSETIDEDDYTTKTHTESFNVTQGDILIFRLQSGQTRSFDNVNWTQEITYNSQVSGYDQYGKNNNNYASDEDFTVSGKSYFQAHKGSSTAKVKVDVKNTGSGNGFTLKIRQYDKTGNRLDSLITAITPVYDDSLNKTFSLSKSDMVKIEAFSQGGTDWGKIEISPVITYIFMDTTVVNNEPISTPDTLYYYPPAYIDYNNAPVTTIDSIEQYLFGPMYRGWGQFAYHNNSEQSADSVINISLLKVNPLLFNPSNIDTNDFYNGIPIDTSYHNIEDAVTAFEGAGFYSPISYDSRWVEMQPDSRSWTWRGFSLTTHVGRTLMSNTRQPDDGLDPDLADIPEYDHPVPVVGGGGAKSSESKTIRKLTFNVPTDFSFSDGITNIGESISFGFNWVRDDYVDLNGDGFPDFVGSAKVQYSTPWGGIGTMKSHPDFFQGINCANPYSVGTTFSASYPIVKRMTTNNPKTAKITVEGHGSLGASLGASGSHTDYTITDINGDGLPDMVCATRHVALNTGYSFLPFEQWNYSIVGEGLSSSRGLNLGASFAGYESDMAQGSISFGLGIGESGNTNVFSLMDFNGDGLPDKVREASFGELKVSYNLGAGRWSGEETVSNVRVGHSTSYNESLNLGVTAGFTFFGIIKLCVGLNGSPYNRSFSKDSLQIADINCDGLPDYVTSTEENQMKVRYNTAAKTNLLRKVTNFTGATITLDYEPSQHEFDKPHHAMLLAKVETDDPTSPIAGHRTLTKYIYENPHYDRLERSDMGYGVVTTRQYDTGNSDSLYRYVVQEFENQNPNKRGRLTRDCLYDKSNRPYIEHLYETTVYDWQGQPYSDPCVAEGSYVAAEADLTNLYEGQPTPQVTTRTQRTYDKYHNITQLIQFGDTTRRDEYTRTTFAYATGMGNNLVSLPTEICIYDYNNNLLQRQESIYTSKGKPDRIVMHNSPDSLNALFDFEYSDGYGNTTKATLPRNTQNQRIEITYQYDNTAHTYPVRTENTSLGLFSTAEYNFYFGKPIRITDINNNTTTYEYDCSGRCTQITGPNEYNGTSSTSSISIFYSPKNYGSIDIFNNQDLSHAVTHVYDVQHSNSDRGIVSFTYADGLGRILQTKRDTEIGAQLRSEVGNMAEYDCFGRTIRVYKPYSDNAITIVDHSFHCPYNPYRDTTTMTRLRYDVLDRNTWTRLPNADSTTTAYGFATLINKIYQATTSTDPKGVATTTLFNTENKPVIIKAPLNANTAFTYDPLGRLLTSTDPENVVTTYTYDMLGQMTQQSNPDAGTYHYIYDPSGNMTRLVNPLNDTIKYSYNFNQLTRIRYPRNAVNNVHYTYGTAADTAINAAGRVLMQEDGSGYKAFEYGKMGEVTKETSTLTLPFENQPYTFTTRYNYDTWGRLLDMTYPDEEKVYYKYDRGGRLQRVYGSVSIPHVNRDIPHPDTTYLYCQYDYIDSIFYNTLGLRDSIRYGNGTRTQYTYDVLDRLAHLSTIDASGDSLQSIAYTFDKASNIIAITNTALELTNNLGGIYSNTYTYDSLYRLIAANGEWHGSNNLSFNNSMQYARNGRITNKAMFAKVLGGSGGLVNYSNNYSYASNNRPDILTSIGSTEFGWNAAGNLIFMGEGRTARRLTWTEDNRLIKVTEDVAPKYHSFYRYDAGGERTYKLVYNDVSSSYRPRYDFVGATMYPNPFLVITPEGYTKHYYAGTERIAAQIGKGRFNNVNTSIANADSTTAKLTAVNSIATYLANYATQKFAYLNTLPILNTTEKEIYYYHTDHLGSSAWITDSLGVAVQHLAYLPWGEPFVTQKTGNFNPTYTFSGKERDEETGYSYFGQRFYDSELSVWLSVDPMRQKYPQFTPFNYCENNPIKIIDPNGMNGVKVIDKESKTITIKANYYVTTSSPYLRTHYPKGDIRFMQDNINNTLNKKNYKYEADGVSYSVKFDLQFIAAGNYNDAEKAAMEDPLGNLFTKLPDGSGIFKPQENEDGSWTHRGGVTIDHRIIAMNSRYDNLRRRIHEIFHTLFFDNDNAESGIGNYNPGTSLPNQNDIDMLLSNPQLPEELK